MKDNFFNNKKVLVTGGNGFLGKPLVQKLKEKGATLYVPSSKDYDLREEAEVRKLFFDLNPEIVIHLAVDGGGIGYMRTHPGSVYYNNIMMNTLVLENARKSRIEKFVGIGSVCAYPKFANIPFKEEEIWEGYPEETNAPYGLAKKMMMVQSQAYRQQYNFDAIHLLLVNLYGPYDDFDRETSHVIPGLIKTFYEAKQKNAKAVEVWGTGSASREFLYSEDAADAVILATESYSKPAPINIGSGMEITIRGLVGKIAEITGFQGEIKWDITKPDGQPRRCLEVSKAEKEFGFKAKTEFEEGLKKTIDWYSANVPK
jgi:GDP-L-fucose synthase